MDKKMRYEVTTDCGETGLHAAIGLMQEYVGLQLLDKPKLPIRIVRSLEKIAKTELSQADVSSKWLDQAIDTLLEAAKKTRTIKVSRGFAEYAQLICSLRPTADDVSSDRRCTVKGATGRSISPHLFNSCAPL